MRMTLVIEEATLERVVAATGESTKSKAVRKALEKYIYWEAVKGLREMAGKIDIVDNWDELRHMEPR